MTEPAKSIVACCALVLGMVAITAITVAVVGCRLRDLLPDRSPPETDSGWQLDWDIEDLTTGEITFED